MTTTDSRLEYSPHKRTRIYMSHLAGNSYSRIANDEGVPRGSISGIIKRYRVQQSAHNCGRSGRPPTVSERDGRVIKLAVRRFPSIKLQEIITEAGLTISTRTLRRWLQKQGIKHNRALQRPHLTARLAEKRLAFARLHVRRPASYWKRWIFNDETTIARGQGGRVKWVWHSQMFRGAFCFNYRTSLYPLLGDPNSPGGGVTSRRILECLQDQLPTICEPGVIFAQDNASTHSARLVQEWLRTWALENGVEVVDWPPYSPDLNPIENLWKMLKEGIYERYPLLAAAPKNADSLQWLCEAAIEVWEDLKEELMERLVESMPRRLEAVIAHNGWYTKY
ncbi:Nuf2 family protein [Pochonia chlamydosporia 170]|uniref:Nuf2 family protein n=1 Tax=Pochonia chlamydosporia 170 TaxID=1380566 RepID=A0A179EY52_METCM|nr:Nuf2 family protein [Pochonia chlamydosporia 170]OAQ58126.2 Nuf2 family protein [Pochonia chlamydosporia 170]